jgi:ATP-dependent Lon protease
MTTSTPDQKHSKKKKKNGKKEKKPQLKSRLRKRKNSSDDGDEENSDVDERGNIKGLIDYDYEDDVYERDVCSDNEEKKSSKTGSKAKTRGKTKGKRGSSLKKCRRSARLAKQNLQSKIHSRAKPNKRRQTLTMVPEYEIFVENDGIIQPHPHYMQMNPPQFQPQIQPAQDDMLTKMMVLSQLCAQVEKMDKRRARKKKKRVKSVESSTEEETSSDEEFDIDEAEEDEEDLRETFTPAEQKYYKSLSKKKRRNAVEEYDILREYHKTEIPLKFKILSLKNTTDQSKCFLLNRLATFQSMEPHENEFHKLNAWFTQFEKLPLTNYVQFPIQKKNNSPKEIYEYLLESRKTMDSAVYGHEHVKDEIIQLISGWISNESGTGQVLALQGPPGNGKTTLVKNGLSKVLGRPFALIALGGAKDSAFMCGHDYTFEGSKPGRIVEVLRDTACMNPVIFFDEIDKLSESPAGKEISNLLCHLLDPVQNSTFQDRYFSGIDIDLSKAMFVLSFNDESKVDPVLKDRMRVIRMRGFKTPEKIKIANEYLLPEICKEFNFKEKDIKLPSESIKHLIDRYTKEHGVRDLRRNLCTVVSKLNVLKLVGKRSDSKIKKIVKYSLPSCKFPIEITSDDIDILLKKNNSTALSVPSMYM